MKFINEKLGCRFSIPDPLRLRHVEVYETARKQAIVAGAQFPPSVNWVGAAAIAEDWECETIPDPHALPLDQLADIHGAVLQIVMWVGGQVAGHVMEKLYVPKN